MSRDKDLGQELHTRTGTLHGRTRLATIHPKNGSGTWYGTWYGRTMLATVHPRNGSGTWTGTQNGRTMLATIHPRNGSGTRTGTWQRRAPEVSDCKPREDICLQSALRIRQKDKRY